MEYIPHVFSIDEYIFETSGIYTEIENPKHTYLGILLYLIKLP